MQMPIYKVAKLMTKEKFSAALIKTDSNEFVGIITDHDIRRRVVSENYNLERPIFEVMSSPLVTIASTSLVFEAFLMIRRPPRSTLSSSSAASDVYKRQRKSAYR